MTWEAPASPFSAFASAVTGILSAKEQGKRDKADADRQAVLDAQSAAASAASVANTKQTTAASIADQARFASDDAQKVITSGSKLTGVPPIPKVDPKDPEMYSKLAAAYAARGVFYSQNGATQAATDAAGLSQKWADIGEKAQSGQLALRKELNEEARTQGQLHRWSAETLASVQKNLNDLAIAAGHDETSANNARIHAAAIISAANTAADAAMARAKLHEHGADVRAGKHEHGLDVRANITHGGKGAKPRSLTPEQEAAIKHKATSLIQSGTMTKEQVRAALVDEYNLAPAQADAIVAEPDDE
jgi:hypothetical protein